MNRNQRRTVFVKDQGRGRKMIMQEPVSIMDRSTYHLIDPETNEIAVQAGSMKSLYSEMSAKDILIITTVQAYHCGILPKKEMNQKQLRETYEDRYLYGDLNEDEMAAA